MRKRSGKSNLKTPGGDIVLLTRRTMVRNERNASVCVFPAFAVCKHLDIRARFTIKEGFRLCGRVPSQMKPGSLLVFRERAGLV